MLGPSRLGKYRLIKDPSHPNANRGGYALEHIVVATRKRGSAPGKGEVVHHVDLNKGNSEPDNLTICTRQQHARYHKQLDVIAAVLIQSGLIIFAEGSGYDVIDDLRQRIGFERVDAALEDAEVDNHFGYVKRRNARERRKAKKAIKKPKPKISKGRAGKLSKKALSKKARAGKLGGLAKAAALTPEQRSAEMRERNRQRWGPREHCPCGKMTIERARARKHKCAVQAQKKEDANPASPVPSATAAATPQQ